MRLQDKDQEQPTLPRSLINDFNVCLLFTVED